MKLVSAQYPLLEELANVYSPDEARILVKDAFERGDSIEGLTQLKREQMINFDNEGLDPVSSGEWLLVKDEAYYFDWRQFKKPLRRRKSEQLVMERLRVHQDQQAVRYGQVFYADDTDGMPLANRRYIAVVNGKHLSGYTDAEGVAYIAASSAGEKIEVHFLFKAPTGLIEDFMEHAND